MPNEAWKSLSDECEDDPDDLFDLLPVPLQQAVARGDVDFDGLIERITRPGSELCPRCGMRPQMTSTPRIGLCRVCFLEATTAAHREYQAEIAAKAEAVTARKVSQRLRDDLGVEPDRGAIARIGKSADWGVRRDGTTTLSWRVAAAETVRGTE